MRRTAALVGVGLLAACLLAGCGPSSVSYNDGYAVGQSIAAVAHGPLAGRAAVVACRRQWSVSGPATDARGAWIQGCVAGIRQLERTVGLGVPTARRWSAQASAR